MTRAVRAKIRNAGPDDLSSILALGKNSPTAAQWSEHTYAAILACNDPSRIALVAEAENQVAGFLLARVAADECELEDIVVDREKRRRGIGRKLMRALISAVRRRQVRRILLEVRDSNAPARRFYEDCGFAAMGSRVAYYRDPQENAVVYTLDLA